MRIVLAFSGGGFRATFYHLGVLLCLRQSRLNQSDPTDTLLAKTVMIAGVSGGSITAAHVCNHWNRFAGFKEEEFKAVVKSLIKFGQSDLRGKIVRSQLYRYPLLLRLLYPRSRTATLMAALREFFARKTFRDVAQQKSDEENSDNRATPVGGAPTLHVLSTNLATGESAVASLDGYGGLDENFVESDSIELALAVTASCAFPSFLPALKICAKDIGGRRDFGHKYLGDGGIFDNSASFDVKKWVNDCDSKDDLVIIRSDAGAPFAVDHSSTFGSVLQCSLRATDVLMRHAAQRAEGEIDQLRDTCPHAQGDLNEQQIAFVSKASTAIHAESQINSLPSEACATMETSCDPCRRLDARQQAETLTSPKDTEERVVCTKCQCPAESGTCIPVLDVRLASRLVEALGDSVAACTRLPDGEYRPSDGIQRAVSLIRTDFNGFSDAEIASLVWMGYLGARAALEQQLRIPCMDWERALQTLPPFFRKYTTAAGKDKCSARLRKSDRRAWGVVAFDRWTFLGFVWVLLTLSAGLLVALRTYTSSWVWERYIYPKNGSVEFVYNYDLDQEFAKLYGTTDTGDADPTVVNQMSGLAELQGKSCNGRVRWNESIDTVRSGVIRYPFPGDSGEVVIEFRGEQNSFTFWQRPMIRNEPNGYLEHFYRPFLDWALNVKSVSIDKPPRRFEISFKDSGGNGEVLAGPFYFSFHGADGQPKRLHMGTMTLKLPK